MTDARAKGLSEATKLCNYFGWDYCSEQSRILSAAFERLINEAEQRAIERAAKMCDEENLLELADNIRALATTPGEKVFDNGTGDQIVRTTFDANGIVVSVEKMPGKKGSR